MASQPGSTEVRTYESIPIVNAGQVWMIVTCVLTIVIPSSLVVLRFIARSRFSSAPLDSSDYCIAAAMAFVLALCIVDFFMVFQGGFTFDLPVILERFGPDALTVFFKCMASWPLLWNCCVLTSKLSVLLMYSTLMPVRNMILSVRIVSAFVVMYNVSGFITGLAICQPYAKNYDWRGEIAGTCGDVKVYYEWLSAINVVSDVVILLLPLPFVYNLQMALRKKLVLVAMFSVGFITCGVTIFRQTLLPGLDATNPTGTGLLAFLFSTVEIGVAVSLACVPFLRPLFRGTFGSSNRSRPEASGYKFSSKGDKPSRSQGFDELPDDASEIQLQQRRPQPGAGGVKVETSWRVEERGVSQQSTDGDFAAYATSPPPNRPF